MNDALAEQQIIGTLIQYPVAVKHIDGLTSSHFQYEQHATIFDSVFRQISSTGRVSIMATGGDSAVVMACITAATNVVNLRHLANNLIEFANRRALILSCESAIQFLQDGNSVVETLPILHSTTEIIALAGSSRFHNAAAVAENIAAQMQEDLPCTPTGLDRLDNALGGGFYAGKAYGFAARKKVGKTILASTISYNLNAENVPHLFICGEMGETEVHQRCLARHLNVHPGAFRSRNRQSMAKKVIEASQTMNKAAVYYDAPGITFDELKQAVGLAKVRYDIKGFILDYWQLVGGKPRGMNQAEHSGEVAQWIADVCRRLGIWAMVMAQVNQDGNTRGGEGIRLSFDQVYQLHREDLSQPQAWFEMMDTRYTQWANVGSKSVPGLLMNEKGPYFEEFAMVEEQEDQPHIFSVAQKT